MFYERATDAVIARDGTVDKLLGEEVIAFFGAPYNEQEHERRAVEVALEVIRVLASFWGDEPLVGAVVGSGVAFVGRVGQGETSDYTAVGQVVNQVMSLREHVHPGELLLMSETYVAVEAQFSNAAARTVTLKPGNERLGVRVVKAAQLEGRVGTRVKDVRALRTILFLDLVGSTDLAVKIGDAAWRDLLAHHYIEVRKLLFEHGGAEVDTAGDGLLATFVAPAEAIRFAHAMGALDRELGLAARVGIHTGEVELDGQAIRGIAVVIASRIGGLANADEILVSGTVRDLVGGSGIEFTDCGVRTLKGVPEPWHIYHAPGA